MAEALARRPLRTFLFGDLSMCRGRTGADIDERMYCLGDAEASLYGIVTLTLITFQHCLRL